MEYNIYEKDNNIILENVPDFSVSQTLECGQCFRFTKISDEKDEYIIVAKGYMLRIEQIDNRIIMYDTDMERFNNLWKDYFDLDTDYNSIKTYLLSKDDKLKEAITVKNGIRILKQDFFETLISFIISQNKQIPHIKKIVSDLCTTYGKPVGSYGERVYYSFPKPEELRFVTEEDYKALKTGFRARYLKDAVDKVLNGDIYEEMFVDYDCIQCEKVLTSITGVGMKVANCVMLFGLNKRDAFPVDVWIKRIMEQLYFGKDTDKEIIKKFAKEQFGEYGGYAQQYLFFYARDLGK